MSSPSKKSARASGFVPKPLPAAREIDDDPDMRAYQEMLANTSSPAASTPGTRRRSIQWDQSVSPKEKGGAGARAVDFEGFDDDDVDDEDDFLIENNPDEALEGVLTFLSVPVDKQSRT